MFSKSSVNVVILGKHKYHLRSEDLEKDLSPLKVLVRRYRRLLRKSSKAAEKDYHNDLILRTYTYHSKVFRAYSKLLQHVRKNPQSLPRALKIVEDSGDDVFKLIERCRTIGIDVDSHLPGEGLYESPDSLPKSVPMGTSVPPRK